MEPYRFHPGTTPLLVSCPHVGTHIPPALAARMTAEAQELADTDWHIERLYDFARDLGASMLVATHSRYVIDLNRPPDGSVLYANANNTELCPTTRFDLKPVYRDGEAPGEAEIKTRVDRYWRPYHDRLVAELQRLKARFGYALLFDAHSIASMVPRFHPTKLWDLNLGSADGTSAAKALIEPVAKACRSANPYTAAIDGRFKGGHITRAYGRPAEGVHAIQLELSQASYMEEAPPYRWRDDLADGIRPTLRRLIETMLAFRPR
ncbi:MAG: N-formylglutamate deformylase [Alphaproteobacteria bacterium]|nr:N-formylglutamate deformylase [Alphaproteobacteria bacterium]